MTRFNLVRHGAILAALLGSTTAARADVTAQQVWDAWKSQMAVYGDAGLTIGAETMSGDTLTVASIAVNVSDEYGDMSVTSMMGPITFTEQGDGTVLIEMPESYPVLISFDNDEYFQLEISQENVQMVASGTPEAVNYDISADRYAIEVAEISPEMEEDATFEAGVVALNDISGSYRIATDNLQRYAYDVEIGSVEADVVIRETGGEGIVSFGGDVAELMLSANVAIPLGMTMADFEDDPGFAQGFAFEGGYGFGQSDYAFELDIDGDYAQGTIGIAGGSFDIAMSLDGARYETRTEGLSANVNIPEEFPLPIDVALDELALAFDVPLSQSDSPRDVSALFALRNLSVGDPIWSMLDPGAVLPRDPGTVVIDLSGQVTPAFDFLDPEQQMQAMMADMPGELNTLTLNELTVRLAGAEVLGTGAFTFDNTDLETFDGLPRPEGMVTLNINGANGLLDKLVQMGLIPEDQVMMPRMMMGMFATPVGDDQLETVLEINEQGQILANGQRLQ